MSSYISKTFPSLALFLAVLLAGFNLLRDSLLFVPYLIEKHSEVYIKQLPQFYHKRGLIVIKILHTLKNPEIILKGFRCNLDSVFAADSYGMSVTSAFQGNAIQLTTSVSEDSLAINYVLQDTARVENVIVRVGDKTWSLLSQKKKEARKARNLRLFNGIVIAILSIAVLLYIRDLRSRIAVLSFFNFSGFSEEIPDESLRHSSIKSPFHKGISLKIIRKVISNSLNNEERKNR